jgi:kinesin family protein C1
MKHTFQVDALLANAMDKRTVGCTALNEQSSRSHMVFTLKIDGTNSSTGVWLGKGTT